MEWNKRWGIAIGVILSMLWGTTAEARLVLRVGIQYVHPGYVVQDSDGYYHGMDTDYMQALAAYAGMECEFVQGSWEECERRLASGEIDVIPGLVKTPELRQQMDFSALPMGKNNSSLFLHGGAKSFDGYGKLGRPVKIGMLSRGFQSPVLPRVAEAEGFSYEPVIFHTAEEMLANYQKQQIDGFLFGNPLQGYEAAAEFDSNYLHFAVRKGNEKLLDQLNMAADRLSLAEPQLLEYLYWQYHDNEEDTPLLLMKSERQYLAEKNKFRIVVPAKERPYSYWEDGEAKGILASLAKKIGEDLGVEVEVFVTKTSAEAFEAVKSGKADFMLGVYSDYGWAAKHNMNITAPMFTAHHTGVTRRHPLSNNPRIAVQRDSFHVERHLKKRFDESQFVYCDTPEDCLRAVSEGRADITYVRIITAQYYIWKGTYPDLMMTGGVAVSYPLSIGVSKEADARLLPILDRELMHMGPYKIWAMINESSVNLETERSIWSLLYMHPRKTLLAFLLAMAVVMLFMLRLMYMRQRHVKTIQQMLFRDASTQLRNRVWLEAEAVKRMSLVSAGTMEQCAVVVFVLPKMEYLEAVYGQHVVDEALRKLALAVDADKKWAQAVGVRSSAGQVIVLTVPQQQNQLLQVVNQAVSHHELLEVGSMRVGISLKAGGSFLKQADSMEETVRQAVLQAEIAASEATENSMRFYDEKLLERQQLALNIQNCMKQAIEKREFEVWYQPKYDLLSRKCVGAEALVRWNSKELGFLLPGQFIDLFERTGFITRLDFYNLEKVFSFQRRRLEHGRPIVPISVNQSRLHLNEPDYLPKMQALTKQFRSAEGIQLEITETAFELEGAKRKKAALTVMLSLKKMGYELSIDDFGSGYSDMALLNVMPFDVMKLDRSLLVAAEGSHRMRTVVKHSVQMAEELGMRVLCEGIETKEQEEILISCGCHYGQGFLYGKPMSEKDFDRFLEEHL
ncbi:MAG: EAL domain-containing protein [Selenomonas sp.]|uniref:EAL domain-containing protein n=1 Tax=Selenomonas sp. TaxID=2053611 RepID=UPI0025DC20C4|nr:EAL domain-containing protein [Selenomonas sp.]MCR5440365.1 EAL domain-containing protein [Selenomonas sp.]